MTPGAIAAIVVSVLAGAAIVAYVIYQIIAAVRRNDSSMWLNVLGARFYLRPDIAKESVVSEPVPTGDRLIAYLYPGIDAVKQAIKIYTPDRIVDASITGVRAYWRPVRRVRRIPGGFEQHPLGPSLMFRDPRLRPAHRTHDWYAGRRIGDLIVVGWNGALPKTALLHEFAHLLLDRNGLNPDAGHTRYPEVWKAAG